MVFVFAATNIALAQNAQSTTNNIVNFTPGTVYANIHTGSADNAQTPSKNLEAYVEYTNGTSSDVVQLKGLNTDRDQWTGEIAIPVNQEFLNIDGQTTSSGIGVHSVNVRLKAGNDNWQCGEVNWRYTPTCGKEQKYHSVLNSFITRPLEIKAEKHTNFKDLALKGKRPETVIVDMLDRFYVAPIYKITY
ncbi:MAG: hypothetical protein HUJ62_07690 [Streptococcus gallolyticus]|nr:hypothetical protein [Streptococcus gallolyticus]